MMHLPLSAELPVGFPVNNLLELEKRSMMSAVFRNISGLDYFYVMGEYRLYGICQDQW